jgi:hypothetical protein
VASERSFTLKARINTESPDAVRPVLERLVPPAKILSGEDPKDLLVEARLLGTTARELNRGLLSELRRAERRTRLRSEWTCDGVTERFFDYVPKGRRGP